MADLDIVPIRFFDGSQPYHFQFDNQPISDIQVQLNLINDELEIDTAEIAAASGSAGDMASRLSVALDSLGNLKASAINAANHLIDDHQDSNSFVRMQFSERTKLSTISSGANSLSVAVNTISTTVPFDSGTVSITGSSTVGWTFSGGMLRANTIFSPVAHFYGVIPVTTDSINFKTTNGGSAYISGSLRIYINGARIPEAPSTIYVATNQNTSIEWVTFSYLEVNSSLGTFQLNTAIDGNDFIQIDYDQSLT